MGVIEDSDLVRAYGGSIKAAVSAVSRMLGVRVMTRDDMRAIALEAVVYKARWGPVDPALMTTIIKRRIIDEFRRLRSSRRKSSPKELPIEGVDCQHHDSLGSELWGDMHRAMESYPDWRATEILRLKLSGYSMEEAAAELSVSPSRASQIFYEALPAMRNALYEMGIKR